jgi:hypothetical protein
MPDVFISYSQQDRDVAKALADFLSECGYDLWWDYELVGGVKFRNKIRAELEAAKAVVVIWTQNSVDSDWVIEEAEDAKHSKKLVATRTKDLDYRNIPLGFRSLQTDLVSEPDKILNALESLGVAPSRPPSISKRGPVFIDKRIDAEAIAKAEQFAHWEFIKDSKDPASFTGFLQQFPTSSFAALARSQLGKLAIEAWHKLRDSEEIPALQEFVRVFDGDARVVEAQGRINAIEARAAEAESWARVKSSADLAAVEAHIARFATGANAAAADALLNKLKHERDAAERWREIADASMPEPFEHFLVAYPDSASAAEARARLDEIRRAQEKQDWDSVKDTRHPRPLLRFVRTYPDGPRVAEAFGLLASLERTVEQEAWCEVKDSDQPIVFKAYLAALPQGGTPRPRERN